MWWQESELVEEINDSKMAGGGWWAYICYWRFPYVKMRFCISMSMQIRLWVNLIIWPESHDRDLSFDAIFESVSLKLPKLWPRMCWPQDAYTFHHNHRNKLWFPSNCNIGHAIWYLPVQHIALNKYEGFVLEFDNIYEFIAFTQDLLAMFHAWKYVTKIWYKFCILISILMK